METWNEQKEIQNRMCVVTLCNALTNDIQTKDLKLILHTYAPGNECTAKYAASVFFPVLTLLLEGFLLQERFHLLRILCTFLWQASTRQVVLAENVVIVVWTT